MDPDLLTKCFHLLVDRHEAFRATFSRRGDEICLQDDARSALEVVDLRNEDAEAAEHYLAALAENIAISPMNLEEGPLVFAWLVMLPENRQELFIAAHHVICDGWTFGMLLNELSTLYNNNGDGASLDAAPSFFDFASRIEAEQITNRDADYWSDAFKHQPPTLDLPLDHSRPLQREFAARRFDYQIDKELVAALKKTAAGQKASLVNVTLAAYFTLLHRLTGNDDIVVGLPVAGQAAFNQLGMAGHLVQLLPIRSDVSRDMPFAQLLQQVKTAVLEASSHPNFTFGSLIKGMKVDRSRVPLISTIFNIDQQMPPLGFRDAEAAVRSIERRAENFEIFLNVVPSDDGMLIEATYATSLFSKETIESWLAAFEHILKTVASDPEALIGAIPLADRLPAVTERVNDTAVEVKHPNLLDALADSLARYPDNVALTCADRSFTYRQLDSARIALANAMWAQGVRAGDIVGVCTKRSEWLAIAPLAVLSLGAAYVPLDPAFPAERLHYILENSSCRLVVGNNNAHRLFSDNGVSILNLSALSTADDQAAPTFDAPSSEAADIAYVIYTSGSTGRPKGVVVGHGALMNFLESMARKPGVGSEDVLLAVTTLAFDISILELFSPLVVGGHVVLAEDTDLKDGDRLAELLDEHGITVLQATPSTWRLLMESRWSKRPDRTRKLKALCGGEPLPIDLAEALLPRVGELWNMFGPTETTVWSSCKRIEALDGPITVGTPIDNTQIYILDEQGGFLQLSCPGEICIGGSGLASGYHANAELTAERFIDHPKLGRLYRTGDVGKLLPDGDVQHLGRLDDQVKLRGYRIELGEIENTIVSSGEVTAAAVYLWTLNESDARLVACCAVDEGARLDTAMLRKHLRSQLPPYMIPQYLVQLRQLPLTPNNKVDRRALPKPKVMESSTLLGGEGLVTDTEKALGAIWSELLHPERPIGRADNFFDVGGHSLLALEAIRQIETKLGTRLEMRTLIINKLSTIAKLLDANDETQEAKNEPIALNAQMRRALSPDQRRLVSMHLDRSYPVTCFNLPALWELNGPFEREQFQNAFERVLARQTALRTTVSTDKDDPLDLSGYYLRSIHRDDHNWLEVIDYRGEASEDSAYEKAVEEIFTLSGAPFTLVDQPLILTKLYQISDSRYLFFFNAHQLIFDGWSFDILLRELETYYSSFSEAKAVDLDRLDLEYRDYCHWVSERQKKRAGGAGDNERLLSAMEQDPFIEAAPEGSLGTTARVSVSLDGAAFERIDLFCKETSLRPYEVFLAAFTASLADQQQLSRFSVALPITGRYIPSVINLIGGFMSVLPFEAERCGSANFGAYCQSLAADLKTFHEHQDWSYAELVSDRRSLTTLARQFSTTFAFQDIRNRPTNFADVQLKQIDCPRVQLELPLEFWVRIQQNSVLLVVDFHDERVERLKMEELLDDISKRLRSLDPSDADSPVEELPSAVSAKSSKSVWRKLFG
ncbi:MAG: non-ribosomal peptide synthetase [Geminicoccaceae bacterium]